MMQVKLQEQLKELENYLPQLDAEDTEVSKSTVGWQVDHTTLVLEGVLKVLKNSKPEDYRYQFNFTRLMIFTLGKIPRGKAKAPKSVRPKESADLEAIKKRIASIQNLLDEVESYSVKANFDHPFFGLLNKPKTLKFLKIHTEHHLKIIRDILK